MKTHFRIVLLSAIALPALALGFISISRSGPAEPLSSPEISNNDATTKPVQDKSITLRKKDAKRKSPSSKSENSQVATKPATIASDFTREDPKTEKLVTIDDKQYPLHAYKTTAIPNDPNANQWWVQNTKLPQAWDIPQGNTQTTLAVIDTGFALNHEEFTNRWAQNSSEQGTTVSENPSRLNCTDRSRALDASCNLVDDDFDTIVDNESGATTLENPSRLNCTDQAKPLTKDCNLIDDDNNGYTDDVTGWDFTNYDNSVQAGEINPNGAGTTHGTLTAGIAAATGNNNKGIAGVDWNTKILPIQAIDDDEYGDTRTVGRSIFYAISRNVDVISLSLGSSAPDAYVRQAVQSAIAQGITVVASSGNDGCNCMLYPANFPEVIAVGALNESSQRASFSSYGENLDFMAPGTNLRSPTWNASNGTSAYASGINGTSFSAPLVSGLITRLISQRPEMTPQQQYAAASENLNRLTLSSSQVRTDALGFGTINAFTATQRVASAFTPNITYAFTPISQGEYLSSTATDETGVYYAHKCDDNDFGTTKVYKLKKGSSTFYSLSHVEAQNAVTNGYSSNLFAYTCLQQPHDKPDTLRMLNIEREF
jgi:hypothetical protein